jgi:hypothetical protein
MPQPKIKYQQLTITITSTGQNIPVELETDKLYNTLTGINLVLTDETAKFSTLKMDVNNTEVLPDNFEVLRIRFRDQSPFGFDYHQLNETASGSKLKVSYTDKGGTTFPYRVIFSFRYENKSKDVKGITEP